MSEAFSLFEVSWEVCNKVGGIHTVLSTKAKTLVAQMGDDYVAIGPWLLTEDRCQLVFREEHGFEDFEEACRAQGVPVRVGRWLIPGQPRAILVEFSSLFAKKDGILAGLWERFRVDSLFGEWDYLEPVLFGVAAGMVIETWCQHFLAGHRGRAVAQFHEWMTGSGLLYLKEKAPTIGTVFTTHATILGRSLASTGQLPADGLAGRAPVEAATQFGVRAKHSMEGACALQADAFTTVSDVTAQEAELFFGRRADPLLPNGIDLDVMDELAGDTTRQEAELLLRNMATRFLGEDCADAALLCISGRYEFHNKGIDMLLDALKLLDERPGKRLIAFVLVPAGNSGVRKEVLERMHMPLERIEGPLGFSTHNLFDFNSDPLHQHCHKLGFANRVGARVKIVQVPVYLNRADGLLGIPYEAALRAMDLSAFPSFYEPWGYTPEESLAMGVPTVTTDCAGFGRFVQAKKLGPEHGVYLLEREHVPYAVASSKLAEDIEEFLEHPRDRELVARICRKTALETAWSDLVAYYHQAFQNALALSGARAAKIGVVDYRPKVLAPVAHLAAGARPRVQSFAVSATLPSTLQGLARLAQNYWWSWDAEATELFASLNQRRWDSCGHNPTAFLRQVFGEDLDQRATDQAWTRRLDATVARFERYLAEASERVELASGVVLTPKKPVAYFCAEFALHESFRIYSGGLGVLAGDHLKSASDLNLPLVGVGLFYRRGYMRQQLSPAGEQLAYDAPNEPDQLPLELVRDEFGQPLLIALQFPASSVTLRVWKVLVGRVPLFLLDSDLPENRPEDRSITHQLYGGDSELRLRQEIVLGKGGVRALARMGFEPSVYHLNEGHAAFAVLERVARKVKDHGLTFDEALVAVRANTVFTTHTPVPAGHDRFGEDLMRRYFSDAPNWVGLPWERFFALGLAEDDRASFNVTYLALHGASFVNGVSKLHGEVSRKLLKPFWPRLLESEVPVSSVTNGVHLATWTDPALAKALGAEGRPVTAEDFRGAARLDPGLLWQIKQQARARLLARAKHSLERSLIERSESPLTLTRALAGLEGNPMVLAFARRFAPYKRAQLLLRDPARLAALLTRRERPLRVIFAGKAHPRDTHGQEILRQVVELARTEPFLGKLFFLEDYDMDLARVLVQGVDVWLNNPVRTLEASGTSGMKVAANGGLNLSVLDGWWVEGCDGKNGWSIGELKAFPSPGLQDELDAGNLYRLLEEEVVPLFYERDERGLPRRWLERVQHSLVTLPTVFNTDRMVSQYRDQAYAEVARDQQGLAANGFQIARRASARHARLRRSFGEITIVGARVSELEGLKVGDSIEVRVEVDLGEHLLPQDLLAEMLVGHTNGGGPELLNMSIVPLHHAGATGRLHAFVGSTRVSRSGSFGYGLRVRAREESPADAVLRDLCLWV